MPNLFRVLGLRTLLKAQALFTPGISQSALLGRSCSLTSNLAGEKHVYTGLQVKPVTYRHKPVLTSIEIQQDKYKKKYKHHQSSSQRTVKGKLRSIYWEFC